MDYEYMLWDSSSDEDTDDEDLLIIMQGLNSLPKRIYRESSDLIAKYTEKEFRERYRLSKALVASLHDRIKHNLPQMRSSSKRDISSLNQLLITLRFYATSSFQIVVGDLAGIHRTTVSRIVKKVSKAIAELHNDVVKFPTTEAERLKTMREFYAIGNFPGVVGCIDCTHVWIKSPGGNTAELYRNRKGFFSLNVQAVCNSKLVVTNLVARWAGSSHDSQIFNQSKICAEFETGMHGQGILLGDSGYQCREYLLTPLLNPHTQAECAYNRAQIKTRNTIERCFGVLKCRFPCLQLKLRLKLLTTQTVILSCVVLHNLCALSGDVDPPDPQVDLTQVRVVDGTEMPAPRQQTGYLVASAHRHTKLIQDYFSANRA